MNELIVERIQEVSNFLSHAKTMKDRDRDMDRAFKALHAAVGCLLESVLLQQSQIEEMKEAQKEYEFIGRGVLDAYEDVRRRNNSLMDTVRKLKERER